LYYNQVLGLPAQLTSLAIFIALLVDAISDPVVGNLSDRLHSRLGRRHPFMYASALPVALSFFLLWNPPSLGKQELFWYLLGMAILVRTLITFYEIPSSALAPELTADYDERTMLATARHFAAWAGGILVSMSAYLFLLVPTDEHPVGQLNPRGYETYGWIAAAMMATAILVSAAGTHRHIPDLKSPPPRRPGSLARTLREIRETLRNRSFFALFGFGIFAAMSGGAVGAMSIYVNTFFWELRNDQIGLLVPSGFVSAAFALFATPWVSARLGKKRAAIGLAAAAIALTPVPYIAHFQGWMPARGSDELLAILILYNVLEVAFIIMSTTLVSAMMADVVEQSELVTGRRSEGIFFAARSFVSKSTSGVGILLASGLLWAIGFPDGAQPGEVDPGVIRKLGLGYAPLLMTLYSLAAATLLGYTITKQQHEANLAALRERGETGTP
jgi:Na+/melibiose symporter-like transporter